MVLFNVKEDNSLKTFEIAINKAKELGTDILAASTTGVTAELLLKKAKEENFQGRIIIITHAYGSREAGTNRMSEEMRAKLAENGAILVTAAHALSGGERGLSSVYHGVFPMELIAATLRLISAGTKVCLEIGLMAMDAGVIPYKKPVVAIGGTGRGADTACVLTPSYSSSILNSRIHEILCKPSLYE